LKTCDGKLRSKKKQKTKKKKKFDTGFIAISLVVVAFRKQEEWKH
jgi:hypothetical protein